MAATAATIKLSGLARMLVQENLLSEAEAINIQSQANIAKTPFITNVIASRKVSAEKIAETSSKSFGFPYFNLDVFNADYFKALLEGSKNVTVEKKNQTAIKLQRKPILTTGNVVPWQMVSSIAMAYKARCVMIVTE